MKAIWSLLAVAGLGVVAVAALAQPPEGPKGRGPRGEGPPHGPPGPPVMRALDTDRDGALSAEEISKASESLKSLDKNDDGQLAEDELRPPRPEFGAGGPGGPDARRGPGRPEGPPPGEGRGPRERRRFSQDGPGGPRGPRGDDFGPPPGPGGPPMMMPPHLREMLELSDEQVTQLDALHRETREKFEKILTADQLKQLKEHAPPGPPRDRD